MLCSPCRGRAEFLGTRFVIPLWLAAIATAAPVPSLPVHFERDSSGRYFSLGPECPLTVATDEIIVSNVHMRLRGASPKARSEGVDPLPSRTNYFVGDPSRWRRSVPQYARVKITEVYPGIDLTVYAVGRSLEFDLEIAPGADPQRIRFVV